MSETVELVATFCSRWVEYGDWAPDGATDAAVSDCEAAVAFRVQSTRSPLNGDRKAAPRRYLHRDTHAGIYVYWDTHAGIYTEIPMQTSTLRYIHMHTYWDTHVGINIEIN